jgi:hypothetical protein
MTSLVFAVSTFGQPPIFEWKPPVFPQAEVRRPDGSPDFLAKSNFVEQVDETVAEASSISNGSGFGATPVLTMIWGMTRPRFTEEREAPPEAEALFKHVKRPKTRYTYDGKILWMGRGIVLNGGQNFRLFRKTKDITLFESRVWKGVVFQRQLTTSTTSFYWEIRTNKGELIRSGS